MKRILSSFAAVTVLALLAASGFADDKCTLNTPVPGADQDPGYQKVTTPALSQNFVQRIAEKKQQAEREGKDIQLVLVGDSITHFWEGGGFGGGFGGFGGGFGGFGGFGGGNRPAGAGAPGAGGNRPAGAGAPGAGGAPAGGMGGFPGFGGGAPGAGAPGAGGAPAGGMGGFPGFGGGAPGAGGAPAGGMGGFPGFGGGAPGAGAPGAGGAPAGGMGGFPGFGGGAPGAGGAPAGGMGGFPGFGGGAPGAGAPGAGGAPAGGMGGFPGFGGGFGGGAPGAGAGGQNNSGNGYSDLAVYHPLNLGFSGDRTENILHVIKNTGIFELIDPKVVTLMIGTNNFGMHESEPVATAEAIRLCVLALKEKAPNAKILLYGIFPRGDGLGDKCAATNKIIKDFADNETVFYEDLTPKFTDENGQLLDGVMNFDRLHPAAKGYQIWAESVKAFMKKVLGDSGDSANATDSSSAAGKLNEPVAAAASDPGTAKVTTAALNPQWAQRIQEKKDQAKSEGKNIKLVLVGDSITHFWEGGFFGGGGQNVYKELTKYNPLNLGFSGDRTEHTLHVIKDAGIFELIDPQVVTVMIGTNNFGMHEAEPAGTAEAIRQIVLAIKEKAPNAKIMLYGIFPRGDGLGDKCAATNKIIKDFADNKTVFYEDLTPKFTDEKGELIQGVMGFDRLHPAEKGYQIWSESIKAFADKYIK